MPASVQGPDLKSQDPRRMPCSRTQIAMCHEEQLGTPGRPNGVPLALAITGRLDVERLARALTAVIEEHRALRTRLSDRDGLPMRVAGTPAHVDLNLIGACGRELARVIAERSHARLDPTREPIALTLVRGETGIHTLIAVFHQALVDDRSKDIFVADLARAYDLALGEPDSYGQRPDHESSFLAAERASIADDQEAARKLWAPVLGELSEQLELPPAAHAAERTLCGTDRAIPIDVPPRTWDPLRELASALGSSLETLLLAAVQTLQFIYAGRYGGIVATLVALDARADEAAGAIGMFTNEAPLALPASS